MTFFVGQGGPFLEMAVPRLALPIEARSPDEPRGPLVDDLEEASKTFNTDNDGYLEELRNLSRTGPAKENTVVDR